MERRNFVRSGIAWMAVPAALPLVPELPSFLADGFGAIEGEIRLNSNENPLGISRAARRAASEALDTLANRYPKADAHLPLRELLAEQHGVSPDNIVLGAGSTELMQISIQSLQAPGYKVVAADPTFDAIHYYSAPSGVEVLTAGLTEDHQHDLQAMEELARGVQGPVLFYLCNPNNPTGTVTRCDDVAAVIDRLPANVHVLVDEAYFEFVEDPDYRTFERLPLENPNVVVIRTFSKVHGMAGMRLGYAIAHGEATGRLSDFASRNNANQIVIAAAAASLRDQDFLRRSIESNRRGKAVLYEVLERLGIEYIPSQTNFSMHRIKGELETYQARMQKAGFLVGRAFPPMNDFNRVSVGTPEEMERFAQTLVDFRAKSWI